MTLNFPSIYFKVKKWLVTYIENQKTLKWEDDFKTGIMILNSALNMRQSSCVNRPWIDNSQVKLFALKQHQMLISIALMSSSYSTVFWFSLYITHFKQFRTINLSNCFFFNVVCSVHSELLDIIFFVTVSILTVNKVWSTEVNPVELPKYLGGGSCLSRNSERLESFPIIGWETTISKYLSRARQS